MPVRVVEHPLIAHKMTNLRDRSTDSKLFREIVAELTLLLAYEATRDLATRPQRITTPITETDGTVLANDDFVIAPILRAGLGMLPGLHTLLPSARVSHLGLRRDEVTKNPETYYYNYPDHLSNATVFVLDPMLATAGSLCAGIDLLKANKPERIIAICLISSPEGAARIEKTHPDVNVFTGAMDERLNGQAFIVPGLGDAGDRLFGTKI